MDAVIDPVKQEIDGRIDQAIANGVALSPADRIKIHDLFALARQKSHKAGKLGTSDPMGKGHAFPMGVGFTRMTRTKERRLDASVRRASEAVVLYKQATQHTEAAERLLAGIGSEAHEQKKADRKAATQRDLVKLLLGAGKGRKLGQYTIERVNKDRDGYPASYTFSGEGIIKGVWDKTDVVKSFFGGDKAAFRELVDRTRAEFEKCPA